MRPIVVDASTVVEYLLRSPAGETLEELLRAGRALHVPALCDVEVCSVVRRAILSRRLGVDRGYDALEDYLDLPFYRHGHTYLLGRIVGLRANFSAHDATYLALAEWLQADFLTTDEALARAVGTHRRHLDVDLLQ